MITYRTLFHNLKVANDNLRTLYSIPKYVLNLYEIEYHYLDVYPSRLEVDTRVGPDYPFCNQLVIYFINSDNKEISIDDISGRNTISVDKNFLSLLSINDIDDVEYTLKYGRLNLYPKGETALLLMPDLINKILTGCNS